VQRRITAGLTFFFGEEWFKTKKLWRDQTLTPPAEDERPGPPAWLMGSYPLLFTGSLLGMLLLGVIGWRWSHGWRAVDAGGGWRCCSFRCPTCSAMRNS
jgi:hypothetical protein